MRSVCDFKGKLNNAWLAVFGEDSVLIVGVKEMVEMKASQ